MKLRTLILVSMFFVVLLPGLVFGSTWARSYASDYDYGDWAEFIQETSDGGFVVLAYSRAFIEGGYWVLKLNALGGMEWDKMYGGTDWDRPGSIQETSDGGFVVVGNTSSFGTIYNDDLWVLKLKATGDVDWQKIYGGPHESEGASSIQETSDGGFIVAGYTASSNQGDDSDVWVLKLNAIGDVDWQKAYGGSDRDSASSIQETSDGGFVVAGSTRSFGAGDSDIWVLKLNAIGNVDWQKTYGGSDRDSASSIQETSGGGFVVAGSTHSFGAGDSDFWVLRLNATGNVDWQKSHGGSDRDSATSIQETSDGGFVVAGINQSYGPGYGAALVLKLNAMGDVDWQKFYAHDSASSGATSIQETSDGGFVVAGRLAYNTWVWKLNANGNLPGCDLDGNSSIAPINTTVTPVVSTTSPRLTTAFPQSTNAIVSGSGAYDETQCGTCEGRCNGKGIGDCWCDAACTSYGDCCLDYGNLCRKTCKNQCGGQSEGGCWCDAACTFYSDCCPDYDLLCNLDPDRS